MLPLSTLWQKQGPTETQYLKNTCLTGLQHGKNHRCLQVGRDGKPNQKLGRPVMWNGKSSSVWQIRCCLEIKKTQGNRLISEFCSWVGALSSLQTNSELDRLLNGQILWFVWFQQGRSFPTLLGTPKGQSIFFRVPNHSEPFSAFLQRKPTLLLMVQKSG